MGNGVSVIIPTWNRAATLGRAIRSALAQTVEVSEVLVCDDGSFDDSREVVRAINDPRVRWVEGQRGGRPAIPRNRGIRESRGDWLAFLDDDDEWLPGKLEKQLTLANRLGCRAACSAAFRSLPGIAVEDAPLAPSGWLVERLTFADLLPSNRVVCSSALVHRSLFDVVKGFPETPLLIVGEDYALWLRVATQTDFAFVPEPLLNYRDDPANSVRINSPDVLTQRRYVLADFKRWAVGKGISQDYRRAAARHYRAAVLGDLRQRCIACAEGLKRTLIG